MFGSHERDFRQPFRTLQLLPLTVDFDTRFSLLQVEIVLCRQLLPASLAQRLNLTVVQCSVRLYHRSFGQVQGSDQLMVGYLAGILHLGELQAERFPLQLIACDIILQCCTLFQPCLHVGDYLVGQFQILVQHLDLVVQLIQIEVMSYEQEADILTILLPVHLRQLLLQFCQFDTAVDSSSGVDRQLCLEGEIVSPVRHLYLGSVAEITVPQLSVSPVAARKRRADVGQPLCLGSFQVLVGNFLSGAERLDTLTVLVGKTKHFFDAHCTRLGTQILAA